MIPCKTAYGSSKLSERDRDGLLRLPTRNNLFFGIFSVEGNLFSTSSLSADSLSPSK